MKNNRKGNIGGGPRRNEPLEARVRRATELIVALGRKEGRDDRSIRAIALDAVREAFTGREPCFRVLVVGRRTQTCTTTAGIYQLLLEHYGVDRADLHAQERWYELVGQTLDRIVPDRP